MHNSTIEARLASPSITGSVVLFYVHTASIARALQLRLPPSILHPLPHNPDQALHLPPRIPRVQAHPHSLLPAGHGRVGDGPDEEPARLEVGREQAGGGGQERDDGGRRGEGGRDVRGEEREVGGRGGEECGKASGQQGRERVKVLGGLQLSAKKLGLASAPAEQCGVPGRWGAGWTDLVRLAPRKERKGVGDGEDVHPRHHGRIDERAGVVDQVGPDQGRGEHDGCERREGQASK